MGDQKSNGSAGKPEVRLKAHAVSRGIAVGRVVCIYGRSRQFFRVQISPDDVALEIRRFLAAVRLARRQLHRLAREASGGSIAGIFEAQKLILEDTSLHSKIESEIKSGLVNAEWAVKTIADEYIAKYKAIPDDHLRERYIDLEDVVERILNALGSGGRSHVQLGDDSIIAAQELKPSTMVELSKHLPRALITENGGWTSHTFILAREVNLPAVTGLKRVLRRLATGDKVIVDGYNGQVILHPADSTVNEYRTISTPPVNGTDIEQTTYKTPKTLDGHEVAVRANLDIPTMYARAKRMGARGIGLYRSEFLFNQFKGFPSESEQVTAYTQVADFAGEDRVKIRTFDLGIDQVYGGAINKEKNPALGLRAIRLSFTNIKQFRIQLRALLRSSSGRHIDIVLPMVSGPDDIEQVRSLIKREQKDLRSKAIPFGEPKLGAMIEVPSAVFLIKEIAEVSDFLSLGTNDLIQYLLAVDRDNESVEDWFRTLHPAVLRAIKNVAETARESRKPLIVCGEMAGSPYYLPLLLGLGIDELSMNVNSILRIRKMIAGIALEECKELADAAVDFSTSSEVEAALLDHIKTKWSHLFPADFFSVKRI